MHSKSKVRQMKEYALAESMDKKADKIADAPTARKKKETIPLVDLLGSGSTPLDLAVSGRVAGAYAKGRYVLLAGVSDSAKTWLALSAFAEATLRPAFKDYRFVYDAPEDGAAMDKAYFFGKQVEKRVEPPKGTKAKPECSKTVEDFYDNVTDALDAAEPFVYVIDSETALGSRVGEKLYQDNRKARRKGNKEKGSYAVEKAKVHAARLRDVRQRLREKGSILIMISHLRENVSITATFEPHKRPGGTALKYYSDVEIWLYRAGEVKAEHAGKKYSVGSRIVAKVKRSRLTGRKAAAAFTIYDTVGIDNVGDCVDYLIDNGRWTKTGRGVLAPDVAPGEPMKRDALIRHVEDNDLEQKLKLCVKDTWQQIRDATAVVRKPRYQ